MEIVLVTAKQGAARCKRHWIPGSGIDTMQNVVWEPAEFYSGRNWRSLHAEPSTGITVVQFHVWVLYKVSLYSDCQVLCMSSKQARCQVTAGATMLSVSHTTVVLTEQTPGRLGTVMSSRYVCHTWRQPHAGSLCPGIWFGLACNSRLTQALIVHWRAAVY